MTCSPRDLASSFNRLLKSISSATNSSRLKPPNFRNARASQKMNEPAIQRLPTAQTTPNPDQPDRPTNRLIKFNRRAAANTAATSNLLRHFGEQFGAWERNPHLQKQTTLRSLPPRLRYAPARSDSRIRTKPGRLVPSPVRQSDQKSYCRKR